MKKRLHDKKAGIAILVSLIIISVAEVIFRAVVVSEIALTTSNLGEQLTVIIFALMILIFTAKGKDRLCYILYGAWAAYFMFDQFFELPANIIGFIMLLAGKINLPSFAIAIVMNASVVLSSIFTIIIGLLLVEYMNDGTIYNKAFNVLCILTSLLILLNMGLTVYDVITSGTTEFLLATFHDLYRLTMIFMFTFFAYDSAKKQLNKVDFSK
jgi:hypothetical protein